MKAYFDADQAEKEKFLENEKQKTQAKEEDANWTKEDI